MISGFFNFFTFLQPYLPNIYKYQAQMDKATNETLHMVFYAGIYAFLVGLPVGILLYVIGKGNILENKWLYSVLSKIINILRSIPFIILISAIPWLIRILAGTTIGVKGATEGLAIGCFPFMARQIELALLSVDKGIIEAYETMEFSAFKIIVFVILKEAFANIVQAVTLTMISLVGFSAVAGSVGGGGLGSFAIQYGYNEFKDDIMLVTVIEILIIVFVLQFIGDTLYKRLKHLK